MNNKILSVNLNEKKIEHIQIEDETLRKYLGGRGLGVKIFTDLVPAKIDPLSSDNIMIFTTGLFSGTSIPANGRFSLVTKSPLTGGIFYSNSGGFFGPNLKRCGIDGILIKGTLSKPGYLFINGDEGAIIKDASDLWSLDTEEAVKKIKDVEGKTVRTLLIGPAGENQVKIASIMNDAERAFGRGGVGAVMGSKMLKAIVVKAGTKKTEINDPEKLKKLVVTAHDKIKVAPITRSSLPKFGTAGLVNIINLLGMFPINNFQKGYDERCEQVSGEAIRDRIFVEKEGCYACPIKCGRKTKAGDMEGKGPEYESLWALGPNLGIYDLITITQANYLCNKMGLDTISSGATIACAMELQQNGLIKDDDIKFENTGILKELIIKIANKEGIGAELSEGSFSLAKKYNSLDCAI
ncbi:MAG: aldehyde ferredoxin oxidoreductase, partial [archaeon]|nr:aldehyde ferredoxin oxidoreductase [archaeon]